MNSRLALHRASKRIRSARTFVSRTLAALALGVALSGCMALDDLSEAPPKLSGKMIAEMSKKGMKPESPVLVRIFKQESELEVWKVNKSGAYRAFEDLSDLPLVGRTRAEDQNGRPACARRLLSCLVRYAEPQLAILRLLQPRLPQPAGIGAWLYRRGADGAMGACSSSGCYAMTDQGVGEIYAIVQKALSGGQEKFQVQAYPFRMTAQNMTSHRGDPNMPFWRTMKEGYDAFEVTRRQPKVSVCDRRYVFNKEFEGGEPADPLAACPPAVNQLEPQAMAKIQAEERKLDTSVTSSIPASSTLSAYSDGGMHPSFRAHS